MRQPGEGALFWGLVAMVSLLCCMVILMLGACGPKHETVTCKDGSVASGTRTREFCAHHGGVAR